MSGRMPFPNVWFIALVRNDMLAKRRRSAMNASVRLVIYQLLSWSLRPLDLTRRQGPVGHQTVPQSPEVLRDKSMSCLA